MKRICALLPLALLCGISAAAQEKPVVTVSPDRLELSISLASGGSLPERFAQTSHKELGNYRLHELEPDDEPGAITRDRTPLLDASGAPQCAGFNCTGVRLRLTSPLAAGQTFILALDRFNNAGSPVTARFTTKAAPAAPENATLSKGPDVYEQRSQLTLRFKSPVTVAGSLVVHRKFYRLTADQTGVEEDSEVILANVNKKRDTLYVLDLYRKLTEGQDLDLYVADGITDGLGQG